MSTSSRERLNRRMMVRLVKGAYWDTEIKRAQERGLDGYPVFTRKAMTDLNYVACARKLLALRPRLFPQFATHNALTVATVLELAGGEGGFEFQRLHGMGEALYAQLSEDRPDSPAAPMRRSAATATCSPIWCGGCSRTAPTRPSSRLPPTRTCRSKTLLRRPAEIIGTRRQRPPSQHPAAARSLPAAAEQFARDRIRRPRGARTQLVVGRRRGRR